MSFFRPKRTAAPATESPGPTTPCAPAEAHPYQINEFFRFRGRLFVRGLVEHAPGDRPRFSLLPPGGPWLPVVAEYDPLNPSTDRRTTFSFSVALPATVKSEQLPHIALFIHFRQDHLNIGQPAWERLKDDGFAASERVFVDFLRGLPPGARVLEIGARARSGITRRELVPATATYVGFDIAAGPNVDVVGDAHELSRHFPPGHFDAVFSVSVWEHLAMPWKVSLELNQVMKPGALVMVNTHQAWPSHEEPWDFYRFSEFAWATLFNAATGFEIVAAGMGSPAVMAAALPEPHLQDQHIEWHYGYLATRCIARKTGPTTLSWPVPTELVSRGLYPH
jgi:hypothetical protein